MQYKNRGSFRRIIELSFFIHIFSIKYKKQITDKELLCFFGVVEWIVVYYFLYSFFFWFNIHLHLDRTVQFSHFNYNKNKINNEHKSEIRALRFGQEKLYLPSFVSCQNLSSDKFRIEFLPVYQSLTIKL